MLQFHIKVAKLYAFRTQTRHNHYLQSYDCSRPIPIIRVEARIDWALE